MPDGYTAVLADAAELPDNRLWFFEAFGESSANEHTLEYERGEDNGYWITLHSARGIVASIGPTEVSDEASALWKAWQQHLTTDWRIPTRRGIHPQGTPSGRY